MSLRGMRFQKGQRLSGTSGAVHCESFDVVKLIVIVLDRAMTRDETVYTDPESFKPERFLNDDGTCNEDDVSIAFGFGRRYVGLI